MGEIRIVSTEPRPFEDRAQAARALAEELSELRGQNPAILGIPRGAVPMAAIIADRLDGDVDVVIVRKLRAPMHPEFAIGSMAEDGHALVNEDVVRRLGISAGYLEREKREQLQQIEERKRRYRSVRSKLPLRDRVVVIVDDGFATGATMQAALWSARREEARKLIAAAPVGAQEAVRDLADHADEVVCLRAPAHFGAVGAFYLRFDQVSDEEVVEVLRRAAAR
ncbi:MAG: phosphoribosyltransferase [Armatimonadota bacterium]